MIYYCYNKNNGYFSGSGIGYIDNDEYGSTTTAALPDKPGFIVKWNGDKWIYRNANPNVISPRQLRLMMLSIGITGNDVEDLLNQLPENQRNAAFIEWEYSTEIDINNQLVKLLSSQLNISDENLVELFASAAEL